uniref:O-antigen ligase domain-containing protein n=1 Tax=candidate division WOR-3 bacterium TaxID=2052148 RepID=A0A7V3ZXX3_UNCW3
MNSFVFLWGLIWGGMYSGPYKWAGGFYNIFDRIHAVRAFLPILGFVLGVLYYFKLRYNNYNKEIPAYNRSGPFLLLLFYGLVGLVFFFLSPMPLEALYWAIAFLAPFTVVYCAFLAKNAYSSLKKVFEINFYLMVFFSLVIFFGPIKDIVLGAPNPRVYELPFSLGTQTANGVGRFGIVAAIVSLIRLWQKGIKKGFWYFMIFLISITNVIYSESRSALYGGLIALAFAGFLTGAFYGKKWRLLFYLPPVFYFFYLSAFKWRAGGEAEGLFNLSGREYTWGRVIETVMISPLTGFGFHADRLLLEGEHVHNAFLHAFIQAGFLGLIFFVASFFLTLIIIARVLLKYQRVYKGVKKVDNTFLEAIGVLVFLMARAFVESTSAFYGIDLLLFLPALAIVQNYKLFMEVQENESQKGASSGNRGGYRRF